VNKKGEAQMHARMSQIHADIGATAQNDSDVIRLHLHNPKSGSWPIASLRRIDGTAETFAGRVDVEWDSGG
jgi:hypothetical protein